MDAGALFGNDATESASSKMKEKEKSFPRQKSSLPARVKHSHRGAGLIFGNDVTLHASSKMKEKEKEKSSSHQKVASRQE